MSKKKCARKYKLKQHMLTQTKGIPHVCEICEKNFLEKANLNHHVRTHTIVRPFGCDDCGRRFENGSTRNYHFSTLTKWNYHSSNHKNKNVVIVHKS